MQWITEQRDKRSHTLVLLAVDVAAAEALGRSRAMKYISSLGHSQPAQNVNKAEQ